MERSFMAECELWATTQGGYPAVPASAASGQEPPWTFFAQIEDALGKDAEPDPAFFIESWTAGLAAAAESFLKRQQRKNREPDPQPPLKLDSFMPFLTVENVGCGEEPEPAAVPAFRVIARKNSRRVDICLALVRLPSTATKVPYSRETG